MQIEKSRKIAWKIKQSPTESMTVTATEQNNRILGINLEQTAMGMTYPQFQEFCNHLAEIKTIIETKYYYQSEASPLAPKPASSPPLPKKKPSLGSPTVPLVAPTELKVPEIYIITKMGACLFHFDFKGHIQTQIVDENLVSGLLSAINLFAENMGWLAGVNLIKAGNIEVRFAKGNLIIVALVTNVEMNLGYLVEPILADLAHELCMQFEGSYSEELEKGNIQGVINAADFQDFKDDFEGFLVKYRNQVFEIYQKMILTEAMYLEVPPDVCSDLIHTVSDGKSVVNELGQLMADYPLIQKAIQKVNFAQKPMWDVFSIPVYEIK